MALFQNDIKNLKKSAVNFLYIFVDGKTKGLSADIMRKRNDQIKQLTEIYQNNAGYSLNDLKNIVWAGITERYGKTPYQMLQTIYNAATKSGVSGIGSTEAVNNLTAVITDSGTTKTGNFWQDAQKVIEWLVAILERIFGTGRRDPNVFSPKSGDWTGPNSPDPSIDDGGYGFPSGNYGEDYPEKKTGMLPILAAGGAMLFLMMGNGGIKPLNPKIPKRKK